MLNEVRAELVLDDNFFAIVEKIDFSKETLDLLFSYKDILSNKDTLDDYYKYLLSFLANYLIFMYDSPTGIDRLDSFDYPILQVLSIQIKNLADYTY